MLKSCEGAPAVLITHVTYPEKQIFSNWEDNWVGSETFVQYAFCCMVRSVYHLIFGGFGQLWRQIMLFVVVA